jgi:hypothetical protein
MFNVNKHPAHPNLGFNPMLSMQSMKASLSLVALVALYSLLDLIDFDHVIQSIKILLVINCIWTLLPEFILKKIATFKNESGVKMPMRGLGANVSVNATLLSLMAPFALINFQSNLWLNLGIVLLTFSAIINTTAASGLISFIVSMWVFFLFEYSHLDHIYYPLLISGLIGGSYCVYRFIKDRNKTSQHLFSLSGRSEIWDFSKSKVKSYGNKWLGIGIGAYSYIMPQMQKAEAREYAVKKVKEYVDSCSFKPTQEQINAVAQKAAREGSTTNGHKYIWMHNDLLQFIIEGGYIGLILFVLAYISVIIVVLLSGNLAALTFIIAYSINSITNFPNHLADNSFLVIVMLKFLFIGA